MSADAVAFASAAQQAVVADKIQVAVLKQIQNAQQAAGAAAVQLIQAAGNIGKATGKGQLFDSAG
jgi:hypothetical protein